MDDVMVRLEHSIVAGLAKPGCNALLRDGAALYELVCEAGKLVLPQLPSDQAMLDAMVLAWLEAAAWLRERGVKASLTNILIRSFVVRAEALKPKQVAL